MLSVCTVLLLMPCTAYKYIIVYVSLSISYTTIDGGQDRVELNRLHHEDRDVGSNPAATKKWTFGDPPTEGNPMVQQDMSGRPAT